MITIPIPEDIVQKDKDELEKINIFTDIHGNKAKTLIYLKTGMTLAQYLYKTKKFLKKSLKLLLTHQTRALQVYTIFLKHIKN